MSEWRESIDNYFTDSDDDFIDSDSNSDESNSNSDVITDITDKLESLDLSSDLPETSESDYRGNHVISLPLLPRNIYNENIEKRKYLSESEVESESEQESESESQTESDTDSIFETILKPKAVSESEVESESEQESDSEEEETESESESESQTESDTDSIFETILKPKAVIDYDSNTEKLVDVLKTTRLNKLGVEGMINAINDIVNDLNDDGIKNINDIKEKGFEIDDIVNKYLKKRGMDVKNILGDIDEPRLTRSMKKRRMINVMI
ncbi:MAG: hypothetical protein RLZZ546_1745 [Bacteroidota bacterium]|jgi:DNA-binding TFAR19-related protein (PDSD5 family)